MLRLCAGDGLDEMFMQRMSGMTYLEKELEVGPPAGRQVLNRPDVIRHNNLP
jgi:hypothetical protein